MLYTSCDKALLNKRIVKVESLADHSQSAYLKTEALQLRPLLTTQQVIL
jgi:hypothetical protein